MPGSLDFHAEQFALQPPAEQTDLVHVIKGVIAAETGAIEHYNRMIEEEVIRLGCIKSLYSDSFFPRAEFDQAYGMAEYERLKAKYDPQRRAPHLFDKCVRRA